MRCSPLIGRSAVAVAFFATGVAATGQVMDFQGLQTAGTGFLRVGRLYVEDGFQVRTLPRTSLNGFLSPHTGNTFYFAGSTALFNNSSNGITELTQVGGGSFQLLSIDLSQLRRNSAITPVTFTGTYSSGGTVSMEAVLPPFSFGFTTYNFSSAWIGLEKVTWVQEALRLHQFDNITLVPAIPLPAMAAIGMGLIGVRRRRPISSPEIHGACCPRSQTV